MADVQPFHSSAQLAKGVRTLEDSIKHIGFLVSDKDSKLDEAELPGLDRLTDDWFDPKVNVEEEEFMRRILGVFQESTHKEVFHNVVGELPKPQQDALHSFIAGNSTAKDAAKEFLPHAAPMASSAALTANNEVHIQSFASRPSLFSKKSPIKVRTFSRAQM